MYILLISIDIGSYVLSEYKLTLRAFYDLLIIKGRKESILIDFYKYFKAILSFRFIQIVFI